MILTYLGFPNVTQCQEANDISGRTDCCPSSTTPCGGDNTPDSVLRFYNVQASNTYRNYEPTTAISYSYLMSQIDRFSPIITFWIPPGAPHFRVVTGYVMDPETNWVAILDPEPLNQGSFVMFTYEDFACTSTSRCAYGPHSSDEYGYITTMSASIVNKSSGKCVDVPSGSTADQVILQQFTCNGGANQNWQPRPSSLVALGGPIVSGNSGKCVDVPSGSTADGAQVQQFTCNGGGNQVWLSVANGQLVNLTSNKCLDVPSGSTADQVKLQQFTCNGGNNQYWSLVGEIVNQNSLECLDVPGGSTADHAMLQQFTCNGGGNQTWQVLPDNGTIVDTNSGKCLDVPSGSTADGVQVQQFTCNGGANQNWQVTPTGQIVNQNSGKCLDVRGASKSDQAAVQQLTCNGGTSQQWSLRPSMSTVCFPCFVQPQ